MDSFEDSLEDNNIDEEGGARVAFIEWASGSEDQCREKMMEKVDPSDDPPPEDQLKSGGRRSRRRGGVLEEEVVGC